MLQYSVIASSVFLCSNMVWNPDNSTLENGFCFDCSLPTSWCWSKVYNYNGGYLKLLLVPSSAKRIATQILVLAKLNGRKDFILRGFVCVKTV